MPSTNRRTGIKYEKPLTYALLTWDPGTSPSPEETRHFCEQLPAVFNGKTAPALRYVEGHSYHDDPCLIASSEPLTEEGVGLVLLHWYASDEDRPSTSAFSIMIPDETPEPAEGRADAERT